MHYRSEIDGLRAVAVIPVILFHFGFETFSGGFVGVDVFFVISGYLIPSIILSDMDKGKFSLVKFYERRVRRILPALFFVMAVSIPFAWMWLMPRDMLDFSQSLIAVSIFSSNILFWRESGYFDTDAELKPLLHTWSLAVEEQYYILFPLFLMLTWRLGKRWILTVLIVVALPSLVLAHWGAYNKPTAAFYLLPARGWEILLGAFVAFYFNKQKTAPFSHNTNQLLSAIGLALIVFSVFAYSKETPFPSLFTLVPTVGTVFVILFTTKDTVVFRLLSNRLMVGVGLISYSAYLWHNPIISFSKHYYAGSVPLFIIVVSVISVFALSYLTYRYIEQPFRRAAILKNRILVFGLSILIATAFIAFGLLGQKSKGWVGRFSVDPEVANFLNFFENSVPNWAYYEREGILEFYREDCNFYDIEKFRSGNDTQIPVEKISDSCYERNTNISHSVFVWGDSHAQMLHYGLRNHLPKDWQILQVASAGCEAQITRFEDKTNYCNYSNWFALKAISDAKPDVVIIGQNVNHTLENMKHLERHLLNMGVSKVVFTGPSPHWTYDLPLMIAHKLWKDTPRFTWFGIEKNSIKTDKGLLDSLSTNGSINYVSIVDYFCNNDGCLTYIGDDKARGITSYDYGHLTPLASDLFAKDVLVKKVIE